MYKTGDLARYLPASLAISSTWAASTSRSRSAASASSWARSKRRWPPCPRCAKVVVLAREDTPGDKRLVAYLVTQAGHSLPETAALRSKLSQSLPDYMLPAHFVHLERLPLTPNGKTRPQGSARAGHDAQRSRLCRPAHANRRNPGGHLGRAAQARQGRHPRQLLRTRRPFPAGDHTHRTHAPRQPLSGCAQPVYHANDCRAGRGSE